MSVVVTLQVHGQQRRQRLELPRGASVSIGRGWENDVVVDDDFVDPVHVRLRRDDSGRLHVKDLDTRNGTRLGKRRLNDESPYAFGTPLAVGESVVSVGDAGSGVAPALALDAVQVAARRFASFGWVALASLLALGSLVANEYLSKAGEATRQSIGNELLGFVMMAVLWTVLAGFVGKLFRHRTHLLLHWMSACLVVVSLSVLNLSSDVLRFNLDMPLAQAVLPMTVTMVCILFIAFVTLSLSTRLGSRLRFALAGLLALTPVAFQVVESTLQEEHLRWSDRPALNRVHLPPALLVRTPVATDAHFAAFERRFAEIDATVEASQADAPAAADAPGSGPIREPIQLSGSD